MNWEDTIRKEEDANKMAKELMKQLFLTYEMLQKVEARDEDFPNSETSKKLLDFLTKFQRNF